MKKPRRKTTTRSQELNPLHYQVAPDISNEVEEVFEDEELAEIKRKSVSGVMSFLLRTAFLQGIGFVSAAILSAYLSPSDFGVFGFVTQIIGILVFFSDVGLAASLIQKKDEPTLIEYRTAFTIQQILSWFIVVLVSLIISTGYVHDKAGTAAVWVLASLALSFPLATFKTIPSIILERKLLYSRMVLPQIFEQLVFHGLLIVLAWQGWGLMSYTYAILARSVIGPIVMWWLQPWSVGLAWNQEAFKALFKFGAKFQLNDLLARIKDQLFYVVLFRFLPAHEFGYIQWAKNWSMYPYNLTVQNVTAITFPTFSRLQHHEKALQSAIEKSLFFISLTIFPLIVGMCVFIWPLTQVIDKYEKWEPAVLSFILFTISIGWGAISTPLTNMLNAIGKINATLKLMIMWTTLTWVLTPALVRWYGFNGVGIAALIISFTSVVPMWYVKKLLPLNYWGNISHAFIASICMAAVGVAGVQWWSFNVQWMLIGMGVTALTYVVCFAALGHQKLLIEIRSLRKKR